MSVFHRFNSSRKVKPLGGKKKKPAGSFTVPRILLGIMIFAGLIFMYGTSAVKRAGFLEYSLPELSAGDIAPDSEIAMIDFEVPKPADQLEEERRRAAANIIPVFTRETRPFFSVKSDIDTLFSLVEKLPAQNVPDSVKTVFEASLSDILTYDDMTAFKKVLSGRKQNVADSMRAGLIHGLETIYRSPVVSRKDDLRYYSNVSIMIDDADTQRIHNIDDILDIASAGDTLRVMLAESLKDDLSSRNLRTVQTIAAKFLRPNLSYGARRTNELRRQAMDAVPVSVSSYKKNERIIEANVPVSEAQIAALNAYREALHSQTYAENRRKHLAVALGKSLVAFGIILILAVYLSLYRKKIFRSIPRLILLAIISALPLSVAYYTAWGGELSSFIVPVAVATILATILFDAEIGIMLSLGVSLLVATLIPGVGLRMALIYFIGGSVGVLTVGRVRHRKEFYRSMFFVPLAMVLTVAATNDWLATSSFTDIGKDMFLAAINGFFCPIIAIGILPLLESVFKIATDITLLELSDLNNPLLKELAVKAPGTFSSVLMVGALAESSAERIGANALLARVGSYYHDIGKSVIPEYFIENQYGGENPHDRLSPHMSALVIASHVKEGYELGIRYGLPESILDIIKQHHGTSLMASIYHKAKEQAGEDDVDESAFRYPGPKPQTREAGIVMLSDLVEAASRTLRDRTPNRLKTLIRTIIQKRFLEGELDECDLTLKDLHNIQESFLPVLIGSYHGRIEYPWQKEADENRTENGGVKPAAGDGREISKSDGK